MATSLKCSTSTANAAQTILERHRPMANFGEVNPMMNTRFNTADQLGIQWPEPEQKPRGSKGKGKSKDKGEASKRETREEGGAEADTYWTWSDEYNKYYHMHEDGSCEWYNEEASSNAATV
ncbi:hypothetical protein ONS95_002760 [Cadophora gregata]|uniref:uncharacterized protein n=1 Tax=Cadophora gregata TaxID=51156 RepID=UPI0026DD5B44|nr:uncharacterized protein ONS95_002760 [Cadophora gregata]KAK0110104.1 hypothetical protein ONS95_002760 [Cadophora gregata]KAK0110279.1 hypothetical protein ONS96_001898 [Cadophora gregata f. sp. sojae]